MGKWLGGEDGEGGGKVYQSVAFVVGHVWGEAGGECLLEDWEVAGTRGVVHAGREGDYFGGFGGRLDGLITAWVRHLEGIEGCLG